MSKTVRRVSLGSLILFVGALGSCYVGERQWERDVQEIERQETASGLRIFDGPSPETNNWQIAGGLAFVAAFSVGTAAYMLGDKRGEVGLSSDGAAERIKDCCCASLRAATTIQG